MMVPPGARQWSGGLQQGRNDPAVARAPRRYELEARTPSLASMKTEKPHDPASETPPSDQRTGTEPDPVEKRLKDDEKSELGGAKN